MFASIAAALISALAATVGTVVSNNNAKRVADQNIAFQREQNALTMEREDTAVQRRALDLERAGLSKTLSAGSPANSAALTAPHNDYVPESVAKTLSKINILDKINESRNLDALVEKNRAETAKIDSETTKNNISNGNLQEYFRMDKERHNKQMSYIDNQTQLIKAQNKIANAEGEYRANIIVAEIDNILSNSNVNYKNIELKSEQIATELARRLNLSENTKKTVADVAVMEYNLKYARRYGLPYGQQVQGGIYGQVLNSLRSSGSEMDNIANGLKAGLARSYFQSGGSNSW